MSTDELKSKLQATLSGNVVVLCVGSLSRGDDMFGPLVAKRLAGKVAAEVIDAENVPENYLGKIAKLAPDVVLLIDSAHFGGEAGQIRLLNPQELNESSFSTHSASLKLIENYFEIECQSKVMLLAAQPKHVNFGQPPSEEMVTAIDVVSQLLTNILGLRSSGEICCGSAAD